MLGSAEYARRVFAFARFAVAFTWEFLVAKRQRRVDHSVPVARVAEPQFITYDVAGLKPFEILLLSYFISLTPGSTTVQVTDDFQTLVLHTLDAYDPPRRARASGPRAQAWHSTLGIFLMLLGLWVHQGEKQTALKILLAIFFQVVTIPVGSHLVALLAFEKDVLRWRQRPMDDHRVKDTR